MAETRYLLQNVQPHFEAIGYRLWNWPLTFMCCQHEWVELHYHLSHTPFWRWRDHLYLYTNCCNRYSWVFPNPPGKCPVGAEVRPLPCPSRYLAVHCHAVGRCDMMWKTAVLHNHKYVHNWARTAVGMSVDWCRSWGAFARRYISSVTSACPSVWNNSAPTGLILKKFDIWVFWKCVEKIQVSLKSDG
jgi:hypothetical protein